VETATDGGGPPAGGPQDGPRGGPDGRPAAKGDPAGPGRRPAAMGDPAGPATLAGLGTFMLDTGGRVTWWSQTAERLVGQTAGHVRGRHVCEAVLTGPDHPALVRRALAEVAAGRVWTGSAHRTHPDGGWLALRCEPLPAPDAGALVIARRAGSAPPAVPPGVAPGPLPASPAAARLLGEAAARIGSTLDLIQTADEAVDVAVPAFADAAVIYACERLLADEMGGSRDGRQAVVRRLAARVDGQPAAVLDGVVPAGEVLAFGADTPYARAMGTGGPVLFGALDGETAERIGRHPAGPGIAAGYTTHLAVPLVARGLVLGCAAFGRTAGRPSFGADEVELASGLAARAAVCIDNARLFHQERRTALALQRGLLPGEPRIPAGLEVAHRYLPVGASVLGGDWYDIVPLSGGRAALIVGDAMGHGPEAAAVMVQLRTAARTLADLELPPEEVLGRLDRLAAGLPGAGMPAAPFATCLYAVIDPQRSSCVLAEAGHLPPVLIRPGGATEVLDLPPGLPLGLGRESFQATEITMPPGATLALYTDGLVESRVRTLDEGITALGDALSAALAPAGSALGRACAAATEALSRHGEDDITLVLARLGRP
jgi:PAS domain S-box-containing protein